MNNGTIRKSIQLDRLKSEQRQANTGDRLSKRLNVYTIVSLYPHANMRGQTRKPHFQQGNTNHVDVVRVVNVRMHNQHCRALVGNAVDYICTIASVMNAQGTPEFPDEWEW